MKRYLGCILILALLIVFITGCSSYKFNAENTSLYIRQDGTVAAVVYEDFDTNTYSQEDLQKYLEEAVSAYNEKTKGENRAYLNQNDKEDSLPVYIDSFEVKDNRAELRIEYADGQTYVEFNEEEEAVTELTCVPVAEASGAGMNLASISGKEDSGEEEVKFSDYAEEKNNWIVAIQGNTAIQLEGKIKAYTNNVTVVDDRNVTVDTGENETAYIIFRR